MEHALEWLDGLEFLPLEDERVFVFGLDGLWEAMVFEDNESSRWFWWQDGYTIPVDDYNLWADCPTCNQLKNESE